MTASASPTITSLSSPPPRRIGIIGAGLAGLSLTLLLARIPQPVEPLHVTVLESRSRHSADGGYLALAPNALHILDQLDLYQKLLPQGFAYEDIAFLSARNLSKIGVVKNGDVHKYGYPALRIARGTVRGELLKAVEGLCGVGGSKPNEKHSFEVELRFETKVVIVQEVDKDASGERKVSVGLSDGEQLAFDVVIGADGIHSRVRNVINSKVQPTYSGMVGIGGGRLDRNAIAKDLRLPAMFLGKSNAYMMMPTVADGSEVSCFATMEMEERDRHGWAKLGEDKKELKRVMVERHCDEASEWPSVVKRACENGEAESLTLWPHYHAPILESWTTPSKRVILMGDSAHAMPPTGGQGAAMAFEDAASLAMVFQQSTTATYFDTGVEEWHVMRQERARKIKAFTSQSGDMRRANPSTLQQIIKEWIMWIYFLVKGSDAGLAWVYSHKEQCPGSATKGVDQGYRDQLALKKGKYID